jgi:hypothetical protein
MDVHFTQHGIAVSDSGLKRQLVHELVDVVSNGEQKPFGRNNASDRMSIDVSLNPR